MQSLLLIDIQNDYFPGGTNTLVNADEAAKNAAKVLQFFRSKNLPVIHIQHIANRPGATFFLPATKGVEIHELVQPAAFEPVIVKHVPNGFLGTLLLETLKQKEVTELVICGMMTHMCVDANTRAAKDLGFKCTVLADACATKDLQILGKTIEAEEVHQSFLAALNYYYAEVLNTQEWLDKHHD